MKKHRARIPAILTQSWVAAALCVACAAGTAAQAGQLGDLAIFSGYRQDTQSFSICSGLNTPDYFGYGKMKGRQINIWEIGAAGTWRFSDHFDLFANATYGKVLGGKIRDSGVSDILSNPFNSRVGSLYTACCAPCNCKTNACNCPCSQERTFAESTQVRAGAGGNIWDVNFGLAYAFGVADDLYLVPSIGYAYNSQRTLFRNSVWGPIQATCSLQPCPGPSEYLPNSLVAYGNPTEYTVRLRNLAPADRNINPSAMAIHPTCISFGDCFDKNSYRSTWNGGFVGLSAAYAMDNFAFNLDYRFYLQQYTGTFKSLGGCQSGTDGCACNFCPEFYQVYGLGSEFPFTPNDLQQRLIGFQGSELRFSSIAYGQEISGCMEYRCGDTIASLYGGWQYRTASKCVQTPCASNVEVINGHMDAEVQSVDGIIVDYVAPDTSYPIWNSAIFQRARWSSWRIGVGLAYLF